MIVPTLLLSECSLFSFGTGLCDLSPKPWPGYIEFLRRQEVWSEGHTQSQANSCTSSCPEGQALVSVTKPTYKVFPNLLSVFGEGSTRF